MQEVTSHRNHCLPRRPKHIPAVGPYCWRCSVHSHTCCSETILHPKRRIFKLAQNDQHSWTYALKGSNHAVLSNFAGGHWGSVLVGWPIGMGLQANAGSDIASQPLPPPAT
eukprot:1146895-Pelagomonas_calceolata.AAC.2